MFTFSLTGERLVRVVFDLGPALSDALARLTLGTPEILTRLDKLMAAYEEIKSELDATKQAVANAQAAITAKVADLEAKVAALGLTPEQLTDIHAAFDALRTDIAAVAGS